MSEAKHTPGPWQVSWSADVTGYPVFAIHGFSGAEKWNEPVLDADARLIAAAPDLLKALQLIIADFGDYPASERPCHAFDVAHAAIQRATEA